jgi:putative heme-binding domain-containing protein
MDSRGGHLQAANGPFGRAGGVGREGRVGRTLLAVAATVLIAATGAFAQQHETAADIEDGGRVFRTSCANCHGQDGDQVPGVDLGRGQFKRAQTDQDLIAIIQKGIPNTSMPATNFSTEQAARVVAYVRSVAASKRGGTVAGDTARGKGLFEGKGTCTTCHRVGSVGSRVAPDLSGIGLARRAMELEQSIVDPEADIQITNRTYRVVGKDGTATTGRLLNIDSFSVQLLDTKEQLRSFLKSDLREHGFAASPMPSYRSRLTTQEIADLVSYLVSLKERATP